MPRTLKTLLNDTYTYFMFSDYPIAEKGLTRYVFLKNTLVEITVDDDCSEFAIILNKRIDEDHHIAWARLSRDNYKEAKKYFDFLIEVIEETAEGGHVCEEMVVAMAERINKYVERKLAREKKKEEQNNK